MTAFRRSGVPLVSVVMPVFNGGRYLADAIKSVLRQTYRHFELIIIDDGSTDSSASIARSVSDPRVRLLSNGRNLGLVASRNRGLDEARGEYIAFLDSDDVARSRRLQVQIAFLQSRPDYAGVGGWAQPIDSNGRPRRHRWELPGDAEYCRAILLYRQYFNTSAFTGRSSVLSKLRFRATFPLAEDYDLYVRASQIGRIHNLPQVLVDCRLHDTNTTTLRRVDLQVCLANLNRYQLSELGIDATEGELELHRHVDWLHLKPTDEVVGRVEAWLQRILEANRRSGTYHAEALQSATARAWLQVCEHALWRGHVPTLRRYLASGLCRPLAAGRSHTAKYLAKSLIRAAQAVAT